MMSIFNRVIFLFSPGILLLTLISPVNAEDQLVLAVHPFVSPEEVVKKFSPLADYLSDQAGVKVKVLVGADYDEHIQYIGLDKVDIAYMGPASFVKMTAEFGEKPILARLEVDGKPWFQGDIIARKDSGITSLEDLKGKRIAFGDPNSTMSHIVPQYMLYMKGVFNHPQTEYQFLHSHDNVALAVLSGDFDAGAVKPAVFRKYESQGLRSIAVTPRISEHLFVVRSDMPENRVRQLRNIMLNMNHSVRGLKALHSIKGTITGLVEASNSDYDNLREIIRLDESIE